MGCGNSTTVKSFNDQEAKQYNRNHQNTERKTQANSNSRQSDHSEAPNIPARQSSATSSASKKNKSRTPSAKSTNSRQSVREFSAKTKDTYTIHRNGSAASNRSFRNDKPYDENKNVEPVKDIDYDSERERLKAEEELKRQEAERQYEEIQKQTFLTNSEHGDQNENNVNDIEDSTDKNQNNKQYFSEFSAPETKADRAKAHEEKAKLKEIRRLAYDHDARIKEDAAELNLTPLNIPEMDPDQTIGNYTVDDIVEHNNEVGNNDWFKYGKKIYSFQKMRPILKERIDDLNGTGRLSSYTYSIDPDCNCPTDILHRAELLITKEEFTKMLAVCHVGNSVAISPDEYRARIKQSVEHVLEDPDIDYMPSYKAQLSRWLADYPYNKINNEPLDGNVDPNEQVFPLPKDIMADPTVMRKWAQTWEPFDMEIPEEGPWPLLPFLDIEWGDAHEEFANMVQTGHDDQALEPLDMAIDGNVAWTEIELDLYKNDITTQEQDEIWKLRGTRQNIINDPVWQAERRTKLGEALKARYENSNMNYPLEEHAKFAELLEADWKKFQELCEKEFIPPVSNLMVFNKANDSEHNAKSNDQECISDSPRLLDQPEENEYDDDNPFAIKDDSKDDNDDEYGQHNVLELESASKSPDKLVLNGDIDDNDNNDDDDRQSNVSEKSPRIKSPERLVVNGDNNDDTDNNKESENEAGSGSKSPEILVMNGDNNDNDNAIGRANSSGSKSPDKLVLDGEARNNVPERGSTTETMDSGLELDNFDNFSKT
ncbi:hypothetical protein ACF0H5_002685 [Mactra antiquata]